MSDNTQHTHIRVLLIGSDQPVFRALHERIVREGGEFFHHEETEGVRQAITRLRPSIVILDLSGDIAQAFSVLSEIRHADDPEVASVPVIIFSESGDLIEISQALKEGISDYVIKRTFDIDQACAKMYRHARVLTPIAPTSDQTGTVSDAQAASSDGGQPHEISVLVVEDDKYLRDLVVQKLTQEGFRVHVAIDGEQGVALATSEIPDIVLLDILLPGIDGFEVLRRIRANSALAKTHVVMLSNFGQREDIEKALKSGAERFFIKANYTLDEIVDEVKKILANPMRAM